jgi:predicted transcriptional regulator
MQQDLEISQDSFRLVRISQLDARELSDSFHYLRHTILRSEDSYPGISRWFDSKVMHGIRTGERTGFLGLLNDRPVAAAIVKRGYSSKFCHLKIDDDARSHSLGDLFFTLMTLDIRERARTVRFTLPEGVWEDRKTFFNSFGFENAGRSNRQYRLFETELFSQAEFHQVFQASQSKLPKVFGQLAIGDHSLLTGAVLAIHPAHMEKIFSGEKTVEIRTRFSDKWEGKRVSLYSTAPVSGLAGEARIARVIKGTPNRIWELFGHVTGCTRHQYDAYIGSREQAHALMLDCIKPFSDPIPLQQLSHLLGITLTAPQSYLSLQGNDGWLAGVALAAALQGAIRITRRQPSVIRANSALTAESEFSNYVG